MKYTIDTEIEDDGRWIAEVLEIPGVMAYGSTRDEAIANAKALALRVLADRVQESRSADSMTISFAAA
jgi:predicted RNase H-like HicB family nuclease